MIKLVSIIKTFLLIIVSKVVKLSEL